MKFFITTLLASIAIFCTAPFLEEETAIGCAVITSIFTFIYSIIAIIVISVKKKDSANISDVKVFGKKVILTFLVLSAFLILFFLGLIAMSVAQGILAFFILMLLLASLISVPVIIHARYRRQENKDKMRFLEDLADNNQENEK